MEFEAKHVEAATTRPYPNRIHSDAAVFEIQSRGSNMLLQRESLGSDTHTPGEDAATDESLISLNPTQILEPLVGVKRVYVLFLWSDTVVLTLADRSRTSTSYKASLLTCSIRHVRLRTLSRPAQPMVPYITQSQIRIAGLSSLARCSSSVLIPQCRNSQGRTAFRHRNYHSSRSKDFFWHGARHHLQLCSSTESTR